MLKLYSRLLSGGVITFLVSAAAIIMLRSIVQESQPLRETYLYSGTCEQPCWQGIQPGTRMERRLYDLIEYLNYPYVASARTIEEDDPTTDGEDPRVLQQFELGMRGDILLYDVIIAMGQPSNANLGYVATTTPLDPNQRQSLVGGTLYFGNGLVQVDVVRADREWLFSPDMVVRRIRYFAPNPEGPAMPIGTPRWHGFGRRYGEP
jgi:hypothetical protein